MKTIKMIATLAFFLFLGVGVAYAERFLVLRLGIECTLLASISITGLLFAMLRRAPEGDEGQGGFHIKQSGRRVSRHCRYRPIPSITPPKGSTT